MVSFAGCRRTPTAFRHPAQGWRDNGAPTLGHWPEESKTLKGFRPPACLGVKAATHSGLLFIVNRIPRVARASQPWAEGHYPVGVITPLAEQTRIVAEVERRLSVVEELESVVSANLQRATRLRQSILQKAFTGELA